MFEYTVLATDGQTRVGELQTPHGPMQTPVFMPVGSHGAVKGVSPAELKAAGSQIILANTYHMYLRPGDGLVAEVGGLHAFMGWNGPILTDSGGFQVFSLGERGMTGDVREVLRQVAEEGITFKSHLDGSSHLFTPEKSIQVQQNLGADIIMAFDQPVYGMSGETAAKEAMERSLRWLVRSKEQWGRGNTQKQALFGIVQGGVHRELHRYSAEETVKLNLPGNAIGGLAIGEDRGEMWRAVESINEILPTNKPRYFMGLGDSPYDLLEATSRGIDMYDCVSPSRLARHGVAWNTVGNEEVQEAFWAGNTEALLNLGQELCFERLNLHNSQFKHDTRLFGQFEPRLAYATIRHYVVEGEMLGLRLLTIHNIHLMHVLTAHMRQAIHMGRFAALKNLVK